MDMITLNNTVQMPMLGFGTFLMNGKECEESVLTALHSGYRRLIRRKHMATKKRLEMQSSKAVVRGKIYFSLQR